MAKIINITSLYAKIPATTCPPGCGECCGPVPVSAFEAKQLGIQGRLTPIKGQTGQSKSGDPDYFSCTFFDAEKGCTVYDKRPLMCRLFGASHSSGLQCHLGCNTPNGKLSLSKSDDIMRSYSEFFKDAD